MKQNFMYQMLGFSLKKLVFTCFSIQHLSLPVFVLAATIVCMQAEAALLQAVCLQEVMEIIYHRVRAFPNKLGLVDDIVHLWGNQTNPTY